MKRRAYEADRKRGREKGERKSLIFIVVIHSI